MDTTNSTMTTKVTSRLTLAILLRFRFFGSDLCLCQPLWLRLSLHHHRGLVPYLADKPPGRLFLICGPNFSSLFFRASSILKTLLFFSNSLSLFPFLLILPTPFIFLLYHNSIFSTTTGPPERLPLPEKRAFRSGRKIKTLRS